MLNAIVFNLYVMCKLCQFLCNEGSICDEFVLCINPKIVFPLCFQIPSNITALK